jgi:hypothetical protein
MNVPVMVSVSPDYFFQMANSQCPNRTGRQFLVIVADCRGLLAWIKWLEQVANTANKAIFLACWNPTKSLELVWLCQDTNTIVRPFYFLRRTFEKTTLIKFQ